MKNMTKEEGDKHADRPPPNPSSSWPGLGKKTQKEGIREEAVLEVYPQCCGINEEELGRHHFVGNT